MSRYSLDLSAADAEKMESSFKVFRVPVEFSVELTGASAVIGSGGLMQKIPIGVFKSHFIKSPSSAEKYIKRPSLSHACAIEMDFFVVSFDYDGEIKEQKGSPGDYLITRESGANEVCGKDVFENVFIKEADFNNMMLSNRGDFEF